MVGLLKHAKQAGVKWYALLDPNDFVTRDWCRRVVGTRVTIEILREHAGSFGRDPSKVPVESLLGGCECDGPGSRCRHHLAPLMGKSIEKYPIGPKSDQEVAKELAESNKLKKKWEQEKAEKKARRKRKKK